MPQNKKPKKAARAAKKVVRKIAKPKGKPMTGAERRAKLQKAQERQKRLKASKAKKRAPQELGKELVSSGKASKKLVTKKPRKSVRSVKGPAKKGVTKVSSPRPTAPTLRNQARSTMKKNPKVKRPTATPRKIKEKVTKRGRKRKVKY